MSIINIRFKELSNLNSNKLKIMIGQKSKMLLELNFLGNFIIVSCITIFNKKQLINYKSLLGSVFFYFIFYII